MPPIRVIIHGVTGRMGREALAAVVRDPDLKAVGAVDLIDMSDQLPLPNGLGFIPYATTLEAVLLQCQADVVVDFTNASACVAAANVAALQGVHLVTGTSGFNEEDLRGLADLSDSQQVGIIVVPNFALGAVVLNYLVRIASQFFDYVDIFEGHHEAKIDAPSGTALALARTIATQKVFSHPAPEKETLTGTRGGNYNGVSIHSTRMPGRLARHDVVFGASGQTLTLSHDTLNRECYMPGLLLAVKEVVKRKGLTVGLEGVLGLL